MRRLFPLVFFCFVSALFVQAAAERYGPPPGCGCDSFDANGISWLLELAVDTLQSVGLGW